MRCEEARGLLHSYVDDELTAEEAMGLEAHLLDCRECSAEYQALRMVVDTVRGAKPVYRPPEGARWKVVTLVEAHYRRRRALGWFSAAAACIFVAAGVSLALRAHRAAPFEHFVSLAAGAHHQFTRGALELDIRSEDGPAVAAWLGERLPLKVALPRYPVRPEAEQRYSLTGARVLPFQDHTAGYVAYQMRGKPISLLMTSASEVIPSGGQVFRSGVLSFHFLSREGLQLITWVDRGFTYALVSDLQVAGAASCIVCHGRDEERPKFEGLVPSPGRGP